MACVMYHVCTVVECPVLPVWAGMDVSTTSKHYMTSVTYSCLDDYEFSDQSRTRKGATCDYQGYWVPAIVDCVRMYTILFFCNIFVSN